MRAMEIFCYASRLLLVTATGACFVATFPACKQRQFNTQKSDSSKAAGDSASVVGVDFLEPVVKDPLHLTDLAPPLADPPFNSAEDILVPLPGGKAYSTLLSPSGKVMGEISESLAYSPSPWNVVGYEEILKVANKANPSRSAPRPFAGAAVLRILQKNRLEFSKNKEGGKSNTPAMLSQAVGLVGSPRVVSNGYGAIEDASKPFRGACLGFDIRDYSDIRWHYYCAVPGVFRACHRLLAGKYFGMKSRELEMELITKSISAEQFAFKSSALKREDEERVRTYCLDPASIADEPTKKKYDIILSQNEKLFAFNSGDIVRLFNVFYESQVDAATGINMYDYIMRSQVNAFDFKQQQAVLNYYYGQMKPNDGTAFDPQNAADCKAYREHRFKSEFTAFATGTHCDPAASRDLPAFVQPTGGR